MMPPRKLYRIGEVMRYTSLSRQTIHNYTVMGLIREEERGESSNHRYYGEEVFERLRRIQEMKDAQMRLQEIKEVLDGEDAAARGEA
jgi:DNA-binding transcriptional MerR regulator